MTALEDRRPVAAVTTASDSPSVIGEDLGYLLGEHPDIELASIRLIPNGDGTVGIAGRIGELAGVECPQCHQPAGRPHTEYCPLAIREEVFGQLDGVAQPCCRALFDENHPAALLGAHHEPTCSRYMGRRATISQTSQPATRTSQPVTEIRGEAGPELFIEIHGQATPDLVEELRKAIRRAARQDGRSS